MEIQEWQHEIETTRMERPQLLQLLLMVRLLEELQAIRHEFAHANEPDPDAEPDPFQTLNGPRL